MSVINTAGFRLENSYARLPTSLFSRVTPTPVADPRLLLWNESLANELGLDSNAASESELRDIAAGTRLPDGAEPIAQAYAGHQFGHFTMLGDGRAILLGEQRRPDGALRDIQLKGAGPTPYSRRGDGRAALGPMLREYIISEAMHGLGIPSTRSLALVASGEAVWRDTPQPGAVLTRVAASHVRVGTFQYCAARDDREALQALVDHVIERLWPECRQAENPVLALLQAVQESQTRLVSRWLGVGFIHGVMNTDNMAISGETIDYGPCAFLDEYDPQAVFSSIDQQGRYAYRQQPGIVQWNLARFAEALLPLLDPSPDRALEMAAEVINSFPALFERHWQAEMAVKLGLRGQESGDAGLVASLLAGLATAGADWTNSLRSLSEGGSISGLADWHRAWVARIARQGDSQTSLGPSLRQANPAIIPRNHQVEAALAAALEDDFQPARDLLAALADPWTDRPELARYRDPPREHERVLQTFCGT